ncbi:MAG: glycoside hydrolase family 3 protein, partial [Rhizobiales bacterium]|nr:glycoside hydrolase family 3 protein [Hyphomicrobiales bacterium]
AGYPMGMTAHVVYQQLDSELPATLSAAIIQQIIRGKIGFDGLLLSDDISMGALKMPMEERCELAITAGCDIILHCNGVFEEMEIVAQHSPELSGKALERVQATAKAAKASFVETTPDQLKEIRQEFAALMKRVDWLS